MEKVVRWRPDTAEFRIALHDFAHEAFISQRCLGSWVGREHRATVCVETVAQRPDVLVAVRESLVFTPVVGEGRQ